MNVVFHVDNQQHVNQVLNNIENLQAEDSSINIVVVFVKDAIKALLNESPHKQKLILLNLKGVLFEACQHSLKKQEVAANQLLAFVKVVSAGVFQVVQYQHNGYAYIKV